MSLLCLLLLPQTAALAQPDQEEERWYDIELLIFKYSNPDEFASENWPDRWSLPDAKDSVDLDRIDAKHRDDFQTLDGTSFGPIPEKLEKSVRYEVLTHAAWRQRGLSRQEAVSVRIRAGRRYLPQAPVPTDSDFGLFEESFIEQGFLPEVTIRRYDETQAKTGNVIHELEGEIKIVLSRFLHVYTDLLLLKPVTLTPVEPTPRQKARNTMAAGGAQDPLAAYQIEWAAQEAGIPEAAPVIDSSDATETLYGFNIKAHRRMRSGELHHIDHPLIGILIQARPVETANP